MEKVIGVIEAEIKLVDGGSLGKDYFEVIDICETKQGDIFYICNEWHKEGVRQLVLKSLVNVFWLVS